MADTNDIKKFNEIENSEWLYSLEYVYQHGGPERVKEILDLLYTRAKQKGLEPQYSENTPYANTIPIEKQPTYPGSREIERRIKSLIRWNAMAMVVRANREESGIGGHISTYASSATLLEVGFNHFFRAKSADHPGDFVFFQGHGAPGIYARAFLEGRFTEKDLVNFRRELRQGGGLSSYPHPWLMPNFWQFPTVSMGLASITAIYQARFNHYLNDRGIKDTSDQNVWAFLGDGELDEPESLGAITLASREELDNLIFVVNCNMQRLDGPVRGNGKVVQELEAAFRGAGWNVIKVLWGDDWDPLFEKDTENILLNRMAEVPDGQWQKYSVSGGKYFRDDFFGVDPRLLKMVEHYSDDQLRKLRRGGHDPEKIYAAYKAATEHKGQPTVILAQTIKGYGLGEAGEGKNITHQQKKLNEQELKEFRSRFGIPISDKEIADAPFYRPEDDSPEIEYLLARRKALGGFVPSRNTDVKPLHRPPDTLFEDFLKGTEEREVSTTMVFVNILSKLLKNKELGKLIVPIVPDEARTFGMESLFRQVGIYSHVGQIYEPVDRDSLLYYKEIKEGAILEEGITEAGAMSSFNAAGTAYANHGVNMIPFFIYYSMFGLQRVGDFIWAAGDMQSKGFLLGGTSGRTTLAGEGLQHQDGNSHVLALPIPNLLAYDPAFAYELAVIIQDGIDRMYHKQENVFYYLTVMNEFYRQPEMPKGAREGILKGIYKFRNASVKGKKYNANLMGSGAILNEVIKAGEILEKDYKVPANIWSVTSYKELYKNGIDTDRHNMLNASDKNEAYLTKTVSGEGNVFVAATDYIKALPHSVAKWIPGKYTVLGTDGFGRSESRASLRNFFEVDAKHIVLAALISLAEEKQIKPAVVAKAVNDLGINPKKANPLYV